MRQVSDGCGYGQSSSTMHEDVSAGWRQGLRAEHTPSLSHPFPPASEDEVAEL